MFQKATETLGANQPKAPSLWGFRRRTPIDQTASAVPADDAAFVADTVTAGFDTFGRSGLQLGGLHRDRQWVGAWGGLC